MLLSSMPLKKDPPSSRRPLRISDTSSAYFFHLTEVIARHHEPTQTQLDALESSYRSTGEYLSSCPEFEGLLVEIHGHGSRQLGTLLRPMDESREGFDIDLIARFDRSALNKYGGEKGPTQLLDDLHTQLARYADTHGLGIQRWERCITLKYAGGMFADIAPVINDPLLAVTYGASHGRIPDRQLQRYEPTNPRGFTTRFGDIASISPVFTIEERVVKAFDSVRRAEVSPLPDPQEVFERLLSRLAQLIKLHRNVAFGGSEAEQDMSPTSIFITTLAAVGYSIEAPRPHDSPMDLLLDIVEAMPRHFERLPKGDGTEDWHLPNPTAPYDNLANGMNSFGRQKAFFAWHQKLMSDLKDILHAIESRAGIDVVLTTVEAAFGKRAAQAIRQDQSHRREESRQTHRATFVTLASVPISTSARPHTFFGG